MKILQITSSIKTDHSHSTQLSDLIIAKLKETSQASVKIRNLRETALPHFTELHLKAFANHQDIGTLEKEKIIQLSDELIQEILDADVLVIGISMYNLTISTMLKSWIDFIARIGKTFRYTPEGSVGLLKDKKVYLAIATGDVYSAEHQLGNDFTENLIRAQMAFFGLTDVASFRVEGLAIPNMKETAYEKVKKNIAEYFMLP
jgi:FMN-dependent NADH-azoreductase